MSKGNRGKKFFYWINQVKTAKVLMKDSDMEEVPEAEYEN